MTAAVIIAAVLLALWPPAYLWAAIRWPGIVPLPSWAERLPAPPALADMLTIPLRLRRATGEHARPLELRRSRNGLLRNGEDPTGEMPVLDDSMFGGVTP